MVLNKTAGVNAIAGNLTIGDNTTTTGFDIVRLDASNQIANTSTVTISGTGSNAGVLRLNGNNEAIALLNSTAVGTGIVENNHASASSTLTVSGATASNFSGLIRNGAAGTLAITKEGAGTLTLGGANTYTGPTTITGGTLALSSSGSINNSPTITVGTGASFDVSAVSGGYSLASGQTLQGIGTVIGPMTVASGSTISPGTSPGNLSVGFLTTFAGGGNYNWQMLNATGAAGTDWDLLTVGGTLNITATSGSKFNLNLWTLSSAFPDVSGAAAMFNPASNYAWKIVGASSISGFDPDKFAINTAATNGAGGFANATSGGTFTISQSGNDLNLNFLAAASGNDLYWNGPGWVTSAPGAGGIGTWADATGSWDPSKKANFSGTAGAVTVGTATANKGLSFLADGYSLTGGTLTLSSTGADNVITVGSGMTTTLSSAIATGAGIIKSGAGNLIFDTTQSYTGGTAVTSGTLTLGHATNTLSDTEAVSISGTLALGANSDTVGPVTLSGGSITGSGTLTSATYSLNGGTVSANLGAGAATSSVGTTALNGTLAADLTVSGGTVNLGASDRLSDTSTLAISSGTFGISTFNDTVGSFALSGTGTLGGSTGILTTAAYALQGGTVNARLGAGAITVSTATTTLGSAGRLTPSSTLAIPSGQLSLGGDESVASFSITAGTLGGSGTLTATTYTLSGGTVSANLGAGAATSSVGTTALNGTLAADLTVSGGTVNLGASDRLSNSSAIAVSSGTLGISTLNDTVGSFTLSGTGTLGGTTGILTTAAYALQGGTVNARLGAGAITVSTATTTLGSAGRLTASSSLAIPSGQLSLGGDESVASLSLSGGTLGGSGVLTAPTYTLSGGTVSANLGAGAATASTGSTALNGTLAGSLTVSGGTVTLGAADRIGNTSAVSVSSGSLNLGGFADTVGPVTLSGGSITNGTLNGSSYTLTGGTLSATITGTGPITSASGTTILSGNSTGFSGTTTVSGGTLNLASSTALGSSAVTLTSGSVLADAGVTNTNTITIGSAGGTAPSLLAGWDFQTTSSGGTAAVAAPSSPLLYNANIGSGTLYLNGTNGSSTWLQATEVGGFGGTAINAGTGFSTSTTSPAALALIGGTANSANGKSLVFAIDMTGRNGLTISYATQRTTTGFTSQAWEYSSNGTTWSPLQTLSTLPTGFAAQTLSSFSALDNVSTGFLRLTVNGASNSTGNNRLDNFQFNTSVATPASGSGTLGISGTGTSTFNGLITVNNTATLTAATGGQANFTNTISGLGSITKTGAGIVNLTGANDFSGGLTASAGTLLVNNTTGSGTGSGALLIGPTATLGGTGTIAGPTTILGAHSPGNSPGIQTFGGDLTYGDGFSTPTVNWELTGNTITGRGANFDGIDVGGNLAFLDPTTLTLKFNGVGSSVNWTDALWGSTNSWLLYSLTSVPGSITGFGNLSISGIDWADASGDLLSVDRNLWGFNLSTSGNDIFLNYVAIPEPSRTLFLALGLLTLTLRRRR